MEPKYWYESKTLWANLLGIVGVFTAKHFGIVITPELAVSILAGINGFLRFMTKKEIVWEK